MKANTLVVLLFFTKLYGRIAGCAQLNDQVGGPDDNNLVFDLPSAKADDYTIEKTLGPNPAYKFAAKPGKALGDVTFENNPFWKKPVDLVLKSLFVYSKNRSPAAFGLELEKDNVSNYIHYKVETVVKPVGMLEFFDIVDSDKFADYNAEQFSFDLVSIFDRRFHKVTSYASADFKKSVFLFHPNSGWFDKVYDDSKLLFEASAPERIVSIKLVMEGVTRVLLQLLVINGSARRHKNYKYDKDWSEISELDFNAFYVDNKYEDINSLMTSLSAKLPVKAYDITNTTILEATRPENHVFLTVPTIVNRFDRLLKLTDSRTEISTEPMENVIVYLYRGSFSAELIEIVRLGSASSRERLENLYFVKSKGVWSKVGQNMFLESVKALVSANVKARGSGEPLIAAANSLDLGFFGSPLPDFDFSKEFGPLTAFEREKTGKEGEKQKEKPEKEGAKDKLTDAEKEKERLKREELERQREKDRINRQKEEREKEMERLNKEQQEKKEAKEKEKIKAEKDKSKGEKDKAKAEQDKSKGDDKGAAEVGAAEVGAASGGAANGGAVNGGAAAGRPDATGIPQGVLQADAKPQVPEPAAKKSGFGAAPLAGAAVVAFALAWASV